ncbi:MAG: hypothetical protein U5K37_02190 [Natrialbaceae archaeon]|nr:hypothetical protein [Natrialbaceae archaeon]
MTYATTAVPGGVVGDADGGGLVHGRVVDERALDLGGADLPTGDVERVVGPPVQEPEAVVVLAGPSRRGSSRSSTGRPVLLEVALVADSTATSSSTEQESRATR